jgi:sugar phosphate isomerase/epimerase
MNTNYSKNGISRRKFIGTATTAAVALAYIPAGFACKGSGSSKPDSNFGGVHIGAITYSWRSMPGSADDIINYCIGAGISSLELMGNVAEEFAGLPALPGRPPRDAQLTDKEKADYQKALDEAKEKQRQWRISLSMDKYKDLRKKFNKAGINIHTVKFSPAGWSDEEIDYAFVAAKTMGAKAVTNEIGHEACERLGKFAGKHNMYAVFHNHGQPGQPGFSFEEFLAYSPNNMLNFDAGHYFGATGNHPNEIIEKLHDRIYSVHLKDKTGPDSEPANTNHPWGEGETPIADILKLIQKNKWPIYCDIELEYNVPEGSDAQKEVAKCVQYCKNILV